MDMINFGLNFNTQNFQMPSFMGAAMDMSQLNNLTNQLPSSYAMPDLGFGNLQNLLQMPQGVDMNQFMSGGMEALEGLMPGMTNATGLNLPEMPSYEYFIDYQRMQSNQTQQKTEFSEQFKNELQSKVDKVFDSFHYEFDSNGNPIMENGSPKLFEGAETGAGEASRIKYETAVRNDMRAQQNAELAEIDEETKAIVQEMMDNPSSASDPDAVTARQERLKALEARESEINSSYDEKIFNKLYGNLPDPETIQYSTQDVLVNSTTDTNTVHTTSVDESTTTTTTTPAVTTTAADGTVTSTQTAADGTVTSSATATDGTVTTTQTAPDGTVTQTITLPDGTSTTTITAADGSVTITDQALTTVEATTTINNTTETETNTTLTYEKQTVADISNSKPMSEYISGKYDEYKAMEAQHTSELANSEAGQAIAKYQAEMTAFTKAQYAMVTYLQNNQESLFDPTQYYDV